MNFTRATQLEPPPLLQDMDELNRWLNRLRDAFNGTNSQLFQGTLNGLVVKTLTPTKAKLFLQTPAGDAFFTDQAYFDGNLDFILPAGLQVAGSATFGGPVQITNQCCFSATRPTAQTIADATSTKIQLNVEQFDQGGYFDAVTNFRFTPLVAGKYLITGHVTLDPGVAGQSMTASIWKNGAIYNGNSQQASSTDALSSSATAVIDFNGTTDYVELYVLHNFGAPANTYVGGEGTGMSGHLIG